MRVLSAKRETLGVVVAARRCLRDDLATFPRKLGERRGEDCCCSGGGSEVAMGISKSEVVTQLAEAGGTLADMMKANSRCGRWE